MGLFWKQQNGEPLRKLRAYLGAEDEIKQETELLRLIYFFHNTINVKIIMPIITNNNVIVERTFYGREITNSENRRYLC